eukprot:SAG11_NODE_1510_length_4770_cov_7.393920_2_plen_116_part_00
MAATSPPIPNNDASVRESECGAAMTFGAAKMGASAGAGSCWKTSRPAPAISPAVSAAASAASSTIGPRAAECNDSPVASGADNKDSGTGMFKGRQRQGKERQRKAENVQDRCAHC